LVPIRVIDEMAYVRPFPRAGFIEYQNHEAAKMSLEFSLLKTLPEKAGKIGLHRQQGPSNPFEGKLQDLERLIRKQRAWNRGSF
jgi:hypothetical protein